MSIKIRALALLLCLILMISAVASCNKDGTEEAVASDVTVTDTDTETETPEENKTLSLKIGGVDISEYRIVYATSYTRIGCYEDYMTYAKFLSQRLEEMTGTQLSVVSDEQAVTGREILLGITKGRTEWGTYFVGKTPMATDGYYSAYEGGKLLLGATCLAGSVDATEAFLEYVASEAENNGEVNVGKGYDKSGVRHVTRIACVGDSITQGYRATDEAKNSYPTMLQRALGYEYDVVNYGCTSKTLCDSALNEYKNRSYISTSGHYDDLIAIAPVTDIVVIMLGTNDGEGSNAEINALLKNNLNAFKEDYKKNLTKMVTDLRAANKEIKIILLNTPISFRQSSESNFNQYIRPYQAQVAEELGIDFYDIYSWTNSNITRTDFIDELHPNDTGYNKLAQGIAVALKSVYGLN